MTTNGYSEAKSLMGESKACSCVILPGLPLLIWVGWNHNLLR